MMHIYAFLNKNWKCSIFTHFEIKKPESGKNDDIYLFLKGSILFVNIKSLNLERTSIFTHF